MKLPRLMSAALSAALFSAIATTASAQVITNTNLGTLNPPTSKTIADTFGASVSFIDNFVFSVPQANVYSIVSTFDTLNVQGIDPNTFQVRLLSGCPTGTFAGCTGTTVQQAWESFTTFTSGGATFLTRAISAPYLAPGTYTFGIRGTSLAGGGSYGGTLAVTPVPEASNALLMLAALGLVGGIGAVVRRRTGADAALA